MTAKPQSMSDDEMRNITNLLYSNDFGQTVARRLSEAGGPSDAPQMLALAGSVPTELVRRAQFEMLASVGSEGPSSLVKAGFFTNVARDPGLLVTLKSLPRDRKNKVLQKQWDDALKDAVLTFRDRLKTAAETRGAGLTVQKPAPVTLHKGHDLQVKAAYTRRWPRDIGEVTGDNVPGSTVVNYIRLEVPDDTKARGILAHYAKNHDKKYGSAKEMYDERSKTAWYTKIRSNSKIPGMRRSIDIVISQNGRGGGFGGGDGFGGQPNAGGGGDNGPKFSVEIITVEMLDPRGGVVNAKLD